MPVLIVYGIPDDRGELFLERLSNELRKGMAEVVPLRITRDDVSIFFPCNLAQSGLGGEIIVFVDGLFTKPERNGSVRAQVAQKVIQVLSHNIRWGDGVKMECFVRPFDPDGGFASLVTGGQPQAQSRA
ncbi:MAG: hypothetical protein WC246_03220 [Candidatus Paceibacterota bacterium]|jgi:hypothetical protein